MLHYVEYLDNNVIKTRLSKIIVKTESDFYKIIMEFKIITNTEILLFVYYPLIESYFIYKDIKIACNNYQFKLDVKYKCKKKYNKEDYYVVSLTKKEIPQMINFLK